MKEEKEKSEPQKSEPVQPPIRVIPNVPIKDNERLHEGVEKWSPKTEEKTQEQK